MKKYILILFRLISILIICISLFHMYSWNNENKENNNLKEELSSKYVIENNITSINDTSNSTTLSQYINFEQLLKSNPNTVGWINISNCKITYPIVQTSDNSYYLNHNFNNEYNSAGWIFADYRNDLTSNEKNTVIYGHNRENSSMFGNLEKYLSNEWCSNIQNHYFEFYTLRKAYMAQIFSVIKINAVEFKTCFEFNSNDDFLTYIKELEQQSIYNFNVELTPYDRILTLYTCDDNSSYRIIVCAKLIEK